MADTSPPPADPPESRRRTGPHGTLTAPRPLAWWQNHCTPDDRRRVMNELAITRVPDWGFRFTVMLTLSVIVAVMGLSANSAAVVIGAMLLAPLMTPVLGLAASLSMGLPGKTTLSATRVALATGWSILIAYALSLLLPDVSLLPDEVWSRTSPDLRDLAVGLAAGAAGAYATVRSDASSSLPGVAVAVALVPPLAVVGITLEAGERGLAGGAFLLYLTNLAAIVLAGVIVFVITGFVPPRRLARTTTRLVVSTLVVGSALVLVTIPLVRASVDAAESATLTQNVAERVDAWIGDLDLDVDDIEISDSRVLVAVRGIDQPVADEDLAARLGTVIDQRSVSVVWTRTIAATTTTTSTPATTMVSDRQQLLARIDQLATAWLAEEAPDADLQAVVITDDQLRFDATGPGSAPSISGLLARLDVEADLPPDVRLNWTEREVLTNGETPADDTVPPTPRELQESAMLEAAVRFADANELVLTGLTFDGQRAEVTLIGEEQPDPAPLIEAIDAIGGSRVTVDIWFTARQRLEVATTTTTDPTATTTNPPTSTTVSTPTTEPPPATGSTTTTSG
ncbi:MAG: DUF389 domain-containing protein [Actinomycetia bacterium]|nr:DUF389 domain-containing protein [Actinomycetes bacterium]